MADRPGSGGPDDGPDFNWLYGKRPQDEPGQGHGEPAEPPPEATRIIPVQPRPSDQAPPPWQSTPPAAPVLAPTPPPGPPPAPHRSGGFWSRRVRRPRFWIRTVLMLLLLWIVYTVAVPFITWRNVDEIAFEPSGDRPAEQDGTTTLIVGSDSRAGLTEAERKEFHTGNPSSELTDTIMLLHSGGGPNLLLSIPRDSQVDLPGVGPSKINSAYSRGGPDLLVQTIENETGIHIDQYVEIGLGGVAGVVDSVGGIEVCPKENLKDPLAGLDIKKGCQEADGRTALAYSRSRHASALGDLARVQRQREVVAAIGKKVISPWTVVNPVHWWQINHSVPDFFAFGKGMSKIDAGRWALAMTRVDGKDGRTCTVPVTDGSATTWDRDRADPLFKAIIDNDIGKVTNAQCTPSGIAGVK